MQKSLLKQSVRAARLLLLCMCCSVLVCSFVSSGSAVAATPKIPLESLFQMIKPEWSNRDIKTGRALDGFLSLSLNGDENAIAYHLPRAPQHIMKSFHGGPGSYYLGVPIILDVERNGREYAQCALIYKSYYLERRDQRLFETIGCDRGAGKPHPVPTSFLSDLQKHGVRNCGPGCKYHFVTSDGPDKQALIQEIKKLYLPDTYNYDMLTLPMEAAEYEITYSVLGGEKFQSITFDVVEERVNGVASSFTIYRLQGPWQNHAALRYGADKNLYFQYYDQPPLGVMEALERDGELKRNINLYVVAGGQIVGHQDASETLRRDQSMDENTRPEYNRQQPALRYDGLDGRSNIFIDGKNQFHHLLETHRGEVQLVWIEKTDTLQFARAWTFEFTGKSVIPEDVDYDLSRRLYLAAGNAMTQDRNSDRYFWAVASEANEDAEELVRAASWIQDPQRLEQEATAARMQADRERRERERLDRKAQIVAENAERDAQHEQHLREVAAREKAVETEVAAAQAAAMAEANAELAKAQQMIDAAQAGSAQPGIGASSRGLVTRSVNMLTTILLLIGGILFSRERFSQLLPPLKPLLEKLYGLMGPLLPAIGVALALCGVLGFVINTLSLALFANVIPQAIALAFGGVLSASKMLEVKAKAQPLAVGDDGSLASRTNEALDQSIQKLGPVLTLINKNQSLIGLAAVGVGCLALVIGGALWFI